MKNKFKSHLLDSGYWMAVILFIAFGCGNPKEAANFQIKGKLSNSKGEFVSLINVNSREIKTIDSVKVDENGEFVFIKKVPEKGFYSIQISPSNFATVIADSSEHITFEGDAKHLSDGYKVSGSKDSETLVKFNELTKNNFKQMEKIRYAQDSIRRVFEAYMNTTTDSVKVDSLSKMLEPTFDVLSGNYQKVLEETGVYIRKFIDENTSSFATLAAVQMLNPEKEIAYYVKVADALSAAYPAVENLKSFKKYVDSKKKLAIGSPAPEISLNDKDGNPILLSSMKGKVVLVDFWASWCKPCRAENPFVVGLYNKYKSKGFDIYSVSLDFKKEAWLEAIAKDKLTWKNHVSDLKQWQSPVVGLYGFEGIPFTVLLDRNGNIAGKNFRGPQLEDKVKELIGNN